MSWTCGSIGFAAGLADCRRNSRTSFFVLMCPLALTSTAPHELAEVGDAGRILFAAPPLLLLEFRLSEVIFVDPCAASSARIVEAVYPRPTFCQISFSVYLALQRSLAEASWHKHQTLYSANCQTLSANHASHIFNATTQW